MTAKEDAERRNRFKQITERYDKPVIDMRTGRRVYVPRAVVEQEEASKRFRFPVEEVEEEDE